MINGIQKIKHLKELSKVIFTSFFICSMFNQQDITCINLATNNNSINSTTQKRKKVTEFKMKVASFTELSNEKITLCHKTENFARNTL